MIGYTFAKRQTNFISRWNISFFNRRNFYFSKKCFDEIKTISTPVFPESISEGDIRWEKKIGDTVFIDEIIGVIETDKTSIEVRAPFSGIVTKLLVEDGDKVVNQQSLVDITLKDIKSKNVETKPTSKVNIEAKVQSEPKKLEKASEVVLNTEFITERTETRVRMSRIRQTIANRLKGAQNTCAMLTTFNEIDMSNIMELRKLYQDQFVKKHGIKLGLMSAFIAASRYALQTVPSVNASITPKGDEIIYYNYVDVSVAVASPKGLVVPVIRDVQKMSFADIEKSLIFLGNKAKEDKISAEDMEGGTFTVSNGGIFGSLLSTPIINPPQSAILGIHSINERPVALNGQVVIRPMMYIALTYDHRLIDGREAVTFLKKIKEVVEDPRVFLLDL